jgi:hypothetical protein
MANSVCATEAPKAPAVEQMANGNGAVTKPEQNGDEEQHVDSMLDTMIEKQRRVTSESRHLPGHHQAPTRAVPDASHGWSTWRSGRSSG